MGQPSHPPPPHCLIFAQQRSIGQTDVLINVYIYVLKTQETLTGDTSNRPWQQSRSRIQTTNKRKVLGLYNVSRSTPLLEEVRPRWSPTNCSPRKDL